MDKIINLLEKLGANSTMQHADEAQLQSVVNPLNLDAEVQAAILARDNQALEMLLGVRNKVVCAVCPAEDEPADEPQQDEDEDAKDSIRNAIVANG